MSAKYSMNRVLAVFGAMAFVFMIGIAAAHAASTNDEFCWRDSYGRGVGTVPGSCASNQQKIGALCYDKCPKGTKRFGFDCHSVCPKGMRNDGLFCRATEYGRGAGYAIWDKKKCEHKHGHCEKYGAMYYPKCKAGYHNFGCCICRPQKPNCTALGLKKGIDLSCAKKVIIGKPKSGRCPSGKVKDGGLCYKKCKTGYKGVGPVCWNKAPHSWVECGMGAAKNKKACASVTFGQVSSVGNMALSVATLGASSEVTEAKNAAEMSKLEKQYAEMKEAYEGFKASKNGQTVLKSYKVGSTGYKTYKAADATAKVQKPTPEDMVRLAAMIAAIADPSGVAGTVAAYTYPKCSKLFK